jgi:hypothetical protein
MLASGRGRYEVSRISRGSRWCGWVASRRVATTNWQTADDWLSNPTSSSTQGPIVISVFRCDCANSDVRNIQIEVRLAERRRERNAELPRNLFDFHERLVSHCNYAFQQYRTTLHPEGMRGAS